MAQERDAFGRFAAGSGRSGNPDALVDPRIEATEALKGLQQFGLDLQLKGVQGGLRRPASMIARVMKELAPVAQGKLEQSITSRQLSRSAGDRLDIFSISIDSKATAAVLIGPNKKVTKGRSSAYIGVVVEGGTKPHRIAPRHGGYLRFSRWGGGVVKGEVMHPGAKAQPFMANSLEAASPAIESLFYEGLAAFLDRQAAAAT